MTTTSDSISTAQSVPYSDRTLRQAVLHQPNDLRIEEVSMPSLEPGDVLARILTAIPDLEVNDGLIRHGFDWR